MRHNKGFKMIYLDWNLIRSYQILMFLTFSIFIIFNEVLNKHAAMKKKYLRANS